MASADDEAKRKRIAAKFEAQVATGEPVVEFLMNDIQRIWISPAGEALVDFVFAKSPDDRATIARLVVTRKAAQSLKAALAENENIPDTPPPPPNPRSRN